MTSNNKYEDKNLVISYLSYLRDISRKIFTRIGFNKCLFNKKYKYLIPLEIKNQEIDLDSINQNLLYKLYKIYEKTNDTEIFIGFGNIIGKNSKIFSAPLLILKANIQIDDNRKTLSIIPEYDTLSINMDLLSSITHEESNEDDFEKELPDSINSRINKFDNELSLLKSKDLFKINELSLKFFNELKMTSYFNEIKLGDNPNLVDEINFFNSDDISNNSKQSLTKEDISFYTVPIIFVQSVPSQLSSYEELSKLILELEKRNSFDNNILEKLLINTLNQKSAKFDTNADYQNFLKNINEFIPMSLSNSQKSAICYAWLNDISYIQGPPGTGKSHTIIAILLTGILLKKRVLVCSQKPAAVKIINERVNNLFSNQDLYNFVNYYNRTSKYELKNHISSIIKLRKELKIDNKLASDKRHLDKIFQVINDLNNQINTEKEFLENELTNQFILKKYIDDYQSNYSEIDSKFDKILKHYNFDYSRFIKKFKKVLNYLESYEKSTSKSLSGDLYIRKLIKSIESILDVQNSKLNKKNIRIFWKYFIEVNEAYNFIIKTNKNIQNDIEVLRSRIDFQKNKLEDLQRQYLYLSFKYDFEKRLISLDDNILNEFSKIISSNQNSFIEKRINDIDYNLLLGIFPIWTSEIRELGKIFPLLPELFDLVIIDESSQVNLAEIIPVLYRAKNICIVGDHLQLGLKSIGMGFSVTRQYDNLTWNKYLAQKISFDEGKVRMLNATQSSVLDFIRSDKNSFSITETLLDEHFRSLPKLAQFTSKYFYSDEDRPDGRLNIMTELPDKMIIKTFQAINTKGEFNRTQEKFNSSEVEEVTAILQALINNINPENKYYIPEIVNKNFTIGIISLIRNQVKKIKVSIEKEFNYDLLQINYNLMIGTPEEFQGNERDIIILSLCLDNNTKIQGGIQFYEDSRRFNVATSRAKYFTYCVHSDIPTGFDKIYKYLNFFNSVPDNLYINETQELSLKPFDPSKIESYFEQIVCEQLFRFKEIHDPNNIISIHNQIKTCGNKRLDFVLLNNANKKSIAIEVDGYKHFTKSSNYREYSQQHIERLEQLKRAGWKIINTSYHKWYNNGVRADYNNSKTLRDEIDRIFDGIKNHLLNEN